MTQPTVSKTAESQLFKEEEDRRLQHPSLCTFYNADFLIYSSMASFYVPCVIMTVLYGRIFRAIRRRERKPKTSMVPSASSAAARRLSCVGSSGSTLRPPTPTDAVPTPRLLEEATLHRPDGCSSVVIDVPLSPPQIKKDADGMQEAEVMTEDDERRQQARPILLLPSGESPRTDDSFECESDRVLAMLPTPYVPSTIVNKTYSSKLSLYCLHKATYRRSSPLDLTINLEKKW